MTEFSTLGLSANLLRGVADLGFTVATPIQQQAIPPALAGRDVLACAMTGSGKTAAFLLPILQRLENAPGGGTRALIVTPTRELAAQIAEHFQGLARHTRLTAAAIYGGVAMGPQERAFRQGVDVLIATPGRLLDHLERPYAKLDKIEVLVLDEADRMLDMGFLPDVRRILRYVPKQRQTLFFSATMPPPIATLSREMLQQPEFLNVERKSLPATKVAQAVFPVAENQKSQLLLELLRRGDLQSALVFTRTKHRANRLADLLVKNGINCDRLHGNRSQGQRTEALAGFKDGRIRVLVATDIAARGIDVEALPHVVNFDVPHVPEDYIHLVGRTARAGAEGDAWTFFSPEERNDLNAIERAIGSRLPQRKLEGFPYGAGPTEKLEIPLAERIQAIRARKSEERARAAAKAQRKAGGAPAAGQGRPQGQGQPGRSRSSEDRRPGQPHTAGGQGNPRGPRQPHAASSQQGQGQGQGQRSGPPSHSSGPGQRPGQPAARHSGPRTPQLPQSTRTLGVGERPGAQLPRAGERRPSGLVARPHPRWRD
jgi:ATP-dependent RNA helicase RhlE